MKPIDKKILQSVKEFDDSLLKYVKSKLLPAFKGLTFGAPQCDYDIDDEGTAVVEGTAVIKGSIYDTANNNTFQYTITLYPEEDKVRISITKFHQGNLCRITDTKHWKISGDNISKQKLKELVNTLNAKDAAYRAKYYGE